MNALFGKERPEIRLVSSNYELAASLQIDPAIHPDDFIFWFVYNRWDGNMERAVNNYFELGKYSCKLAAETLAEVKRVKDACGEDWRCEDLLDFASGYGCTARHLQDAFQGAHVTTCDIHPSAVTFNSNVLGVDSFLSSKTPEKLKVSPQDVILALSFFSHMPNATFARWLQALSRNLKPGGALIFTANGYVTHVTGSAGSTKVAPNGFGFSPSSEQGDLDGSDYGLTVSYPQYVLYALAQIPELRVARFQEGLWWARQDLYVCIKKTASETVL